MDIYILEIVCLGHSRYTQLLGVFDNLRDAEFNKVKWTTFFETKKTEIFDEFTDKMDENGDFIDDKIEYDYFKKISLFRPIFDFKNINITKIEINKSLIYDISQSSELETIMKEFSIKYNRESNLNNLL
jgi:hypothetical protein